MSSDRPGPLTLPPEVVRVERTHDRHRNAATTGVRGTGKLLGHIRLCPGRRFLEWSTPHGEAFEMELRQRQVLRQRARRNAFTEAA